MMDEKWTRNELGFISNGKEFFHQGEMRGLSKIDHDSVAIYFFARILNIKFPDHEDQQKMFDWFRNIMEKDMQKKIDSYNADSVLRNASVEIQNRMAGKIINSGGCGD